MKRTYVLLAALLVMNFAGSAFPQAEPLTVVEKEAEERHKISKSPVALPFPVFNNALYPPAKNFAPSGYMGDIPDIKITGSYKVLLQAGYPALKITYSAKGSLGWAGVVWQNPPNNWGELDGGYNLRLAKKLTFWCRGDKGGEIVEFKIGGTLSNFPDSVNISTGDLVLSSGWTEYTIDLEEVDLSYVSAGFGFILKQESSPEGAVFYLDKIAYE